MTKIEKVASYDGTKLRLCRDVPENPKAVLVISHGLGAHMGMYDAFAPVMNEHGIAVYRFDHRGFGDSEGRRGYVKSFFEMVDDVDFIVSLAKSELPGIPVFLMGHSMGGHVAALYGTKYSENVDGVILCAALLRYNIPLHGCLPRPEDPDDYISCIDACHSTLNIPGAEEMKAAMKQYPDPLAIEKCSISLLNAYKEGFEYLRENTRKFANAVLLTMGGADLYISTKDAIEFYMETSAKDKSLMIYNGVSHNMVNDPAPMGNVITNDIATWIELRS